MKHAKIVEEISDHSDCAWHVQFEGQWRDFGSQALAQEWCKANGLTFVCFNLFGQEVKEVPDASPPTTN